MSANPLAILMDALTGAGITGATDRLVMLTLLARTDARGRCWPSHATISARAGVSVSTTRAALGRLEKAGHIKRDGRSPAGRAIAWIVAPEFRRALDAYERAEAEWLDAEA